MAGNSFGSPVSYPLLDPRVIRNARTRFALDNIPELSRANSLYSAAGLWPNRGWILLRRSDYLNLNLYATNHNLFLYDGTTQLAFNNLVVVQARCVSRSFPQDPNSVYLVEITDQEGLLWNNWYQWPINSNYNVQAPAYPGQYYTASLNAGIPWTWSTMIQDMWQQPGTARLGAFPGLPFTPIGTPVNWIFQGVSLWESLNTVLTQIGCTIQSNQASTPSFTITQDGASDPTFTNLQASKHGLLLGDLDYIDSGAGRLPGIFQLFMHRVNQQYGTEETVRIDAQQWAMNDLYTNDVVPPAKYAQFAASPGRHGQWDDFPVRFDVNGAPLAADVTTAAAVVIDRASQYYGRSLRGSAGYLRQLYSGLQPFSTGSLVDGVCWRQDFREGITRMGWTTEIVAGPQPPWEGILFEGR